MPAAPSTPPRRQPCAWCGEPGRWPDRCGLSSSDPVCAEIVAESCRLGDHRRCGPWHCDLSAESHPAVVAAGVAAAQAAGARFAVVSLIESDDPLIVGVGDHLGRVKSLIRSGHIRRCGFVVNPTSKGLVYVVGRDGCLY